MKMFLFFHILKYILFKICIFNACEDQPCSWLKYNWLFHVECGWTRRKKSDDVELCSHLWFPTPPVWSLQLLQLFSKHENVSVQRVGALPPLKHISALLFFSLSVFLSFWFDSGKSWGKALGSVQQWFLFFYLALVSRGEEKDQDLLQEGGRLFTKLYRIKNF